MSSITILVPVLARPQRVRLLVESIEASRGSIPTRIVFLCSPGDEEEIAAVRKVGLEANVVDWPPGRADYAMKLNLGFAALEDEWAFLGADDLFFHQGWAERALEQHRRTKACVIGTNDGGNPRVLAGQHSTHSLVHRDYAECGTIDDPSVILCPFYDHQWADDEFVQTAVYRGTFSMSRDSHVDHLHPHWGRGEMDATYEKALRDTNADRAIYNSRKWMWGL